MGHGAHTGALFDTFRVPFSRSVRITLEAPPAGTCSSCRNANVGWSLYVVLRGVEGIDGVRLGDLTLPTNSRLRSWRHFGTFPAMAFVPLIDVPRGHAGAVLLTSLAVASGTENFLEGCVRANMEGSATVSLLSSGTEDYFSAHSVRRAYQFAEAGLTHLNDSARAGDPGRWQLSAYKLHEQDTLAFRDGINISWRNGDTASHTTGLICGDVVVPMPPGCYKLWDPRPSEVDALVLAYVYPSSLVVTAAGSGRDDTAATTSSMSATSTAGAKRAAATASRSATREGLARRLFPDRIRVATDHTDSRPRRAQW